MKEKKSLMIGGITLDRLIAWWFAPIFSIIEIFLSVIFFGSQLGMEPHATLQKNKMENYIFTFKTMKQ